MSRPLRIEYPGAFYHVTSRGNERKAIFKSRRDHEKFLEPCRVRHALSTHHNAWTPLNLPGVATAMADGAGR